MSAHCSQTGKKPVGSTTANRRLPSLFCRSPPPPCPAAPLQSTTTITFHKVVLWQIDENVAREIINTDRFDILT